MEESTIVLPSSVEQRILTTLSGDGGYCCGLLMGCWHNDSLIITGAYHCPGTELDDIKHGIMEANSLFPGGMDVCGMYYSYSSNVGEDAIMRNVRQNCASLKDHFRESNLLVCVHQQSLSRHLSENAFWYHIDSGETTRTPEFTQDSEILSAMWRDLLLFRLKTTCQIIVPYNKDPALLKQSLSVELGLQMESLSSSKTSYHVPHSPVLIHNNSEDTDSRKFSGVRPDEPCSELLHLIQSDRDDQLKTRRKIKDYSQEVVNVSVLRCATPRTDDEKAAFFVYIDDEPLQYLSVKIPLDCVVLAECTEPVGNLAALFTRSLCDQLAAVGRCMCQYYQERRLRSCSPVHIHPLGTDSLITVCYPDDVPEDDLTDYRMGLHARLHLPCNRPLLRLSNRFTFPDERHTAGYLQNTHVGLAKPGVGVISCVQGTYSYHHYMQDGINDGGWGCAYRSLQTIVSWFRHQGYTQKPVPSHREIQQALVDVGDKEPSFVGSRQWIGSTEVGYCLDQLLGVQSKFLFVSQGRELADKGRDLATHFIQQGTPIMIGGGVLAHTILGVDFNENTGDVKFLILDPHYTGTEDLKEIQAKGWCGWKGPEFWDQTAFYNLCMPQTPQII